MMGILATSKIYGNYQTSIPKEFRKMVSKIKLSELVYVIEEKIRNPRSTKKGCVVYIHSIVMIIFKIILA